ncbi:hypothetical protein ACRRTK_000042 [Alexandromys fortis]
MQSYGQLTLIPYGYTKNKPSDYGELGSGRALSRLEGFSSISFSTEKIQVGQKAANALKAKRGTNYRVGSSADILSFSLLVKKS